MGLEKEQELLGIYHRLLKRTMVHPSQGWKREVAICFVILNNSVLIYLSFMLIPKSNYSVTAMTAAVKSISTYSQIFYKFITLIFYKKEMAFLEKCMERFWETDSDINDRAFKFTHMALTTFIYIVVICIIANIIFPYYTETLYLEAWIPDFPHALAIIWFYQCAQICSDCCIIIGTDTFFISGCLNMIGQFNLLNLKLRSIKFDGDIDKVAADMNECIEHHKFLLRYIEVLLNCYSLSLLFQYMISTFTICCVLYAITELDNLYDILFNICFMASLTFQLGSFCFPAGEVIEAAAKTSMAAYSCAWYDFPVHMQRDVMPVMNRSQKPINITAGGLIEINKETFTTIFKGAFSFYTAMKNLREKGL